MLKRLKDLMFCPHCGTAINQYEEVIQAKIAETNELSKKYPQYKQNNDSLKQGLYLALELLKGVRH